MSDQAYNLVRSPTAIANQERRDREKQDKEIARTNRELERDAAKAKREEALRSAKPGWLRDTHGLRGPQNPVKPLTIAGADGRGGQMQVAGGRKASDAGDIPDQAQGGNMGTVKAIVINNAGTAETVFVYVQ